MTLFEVQKFKCYGKMMMDGECVRMWKVFIVTHLKVLFWHLPTDTEENFNQNRLRFELYVF